MPATLSKSKYVVGLQCPRRLWLSCHEPDLGTPPTVSLQAVLDQGVEIGRRARELFADGVLVDEEAWEHGQATARTRQLMADGNVGAIFEAAFEHAGVRVRVDVLERVAPRAWGLCEVKQGTSVKDYYLDDAAVQRFVLEGAGVRLPSIEIMHVDREYVRGAEGIDWRRYFRRADVAAQTASLLADVPARVRELLRVLAKRSAPHVEPSPHCSHPYDCQFWEHCTAAKPVDWIVGGLPALTRQRFDRMRAAGIERISEIPDDFPLGRAQARVRAAWLAGGLYLEPGLAAALRRTGPPADYLDFETAFPAIPLYAGMRPYDQVPFQWSLHRLDASGRLLHREFLADGRTDPRPEFARTLLAALCHRHAPIVVWSSFESNRLAELALPDHAKEIAAVRSRLVDLLPIVRGHVGHPEFGGSFSLKQVAPVLASSVDYDDLDCVSEGGEASRALIGLALGAFGSAEEEAAVRRALLEYCRRDTLALVELHRALGRLGPGPGNARQCARR
jgi:predicted RecB family nuclease